MDKQLEQAVASLKQGGVIAYPTEAVFGFGVDPDNTKAIADLLSLKSRPKEKGLILVASHWQQLQDYVDFDALEAPQLARVLASWPGPCTWIMPCKSSRPYLSGDFDSLAVRVSAHQVVQNLCVAYGKPIVSTSANRSGEAPALTSAEVHAAFPEGVAFVVDEKVGTLAQPTQIIDALTGEKLR